MKAHYASTKTKVRASGGNSLFWDTLWRSTRMRTLACLLQLHYGLNSRLSLARLPKGSGGYERPTFWPRLRLRTEGRAYQAVGRAILLYSSEMWPLLVTNERILVVFDSASILYARRPPHFHTGAARPKKASFVWPLCLLGWADQGPTFPHTANWRRGPPHLRESWNFPPDCGASAAQDGGRAGWNSLVSLHGTVETGVFVSVT